MVLDLPYNLTEPRSPNKVTAEQALITCLRTWAGGSTREHEIDFEIDDDLYTLAEHHQVIPLVYSALKKQKRSLDGGTGEKFRRFVMRSAADNLLLMGQLEGLASLLLDSGIPSISFKGPPFAIRIYGHPGMRRSLDLDLLVPPELFARAEALLRSQGYLFAPKHQNKSKLFLRVHLYLSGQRSFAPPQGIGSIDIHKSLMPPGYRYQPDFYALYERSHTWEGSKSIRYFEAEDLLQVLCHQGIKNRWERLKFIADIAALIKAHPELDWDAILKNAIADHTYRILLMGLHLAREVFGISIPSHVQQALHREAWLKDVLEIVRTEFSVREERPLNFALRKQLHSLSLDSAADRVRYGVYTLGRRLFWTTHRS